MNFIPRTFKDSKHIYLVGHNEGKATIEVCLKKKVKILLHSHFNLKVSLVGVSFW